jgi:lysophospholipase L1-like esterase
MIRSNFGGSPARLHFSNALGAVPLEIRDVSLVSRHVGSWGDTRVGAPAGGAVGQVCFGGEGGVTIPPGADAYSDGVDVEIEPGMPLTVTFFVPRWSGPATGHTSTGPSHGMTFVASGNCARSPDQADFDGPSPGTKYFVGLDVLSPGRGAIVAIGDSITEGASADQAYTDFLARRLGNGLVGGGLSVTNAGVGGDALVKILPRRLQNDVLGLSGVIGAIVMIGTNDVGGGREMRPCPAADFVIAGIQHVATSLIHAGLSVWVRPLPPSGDEGCPSLHVPHYSAPERVETRLLINEWIRSSEYYDPAIDFDRALRDPDHPNWIPRDLSADNLHPSTAGHERMADSIDVRVFDQVRR